jgi:hypothetical protein
MIFPTLGMLAAAWLLIVSFLGLETGFRGDIALASGLIAFPLAFASGWSFRAGISVTAIGVILAVTNLLIPVSMGGMASLAVSSAALAIAGMAPQPVTSTKVATEKEGARPLSRTPPPHTGGAPHPVPA